MEASLLEDVRAHCEVREPVTAGVRTVRADPADLGGEMEHDFGAGFIEQPRRILHRGQVVLGAAHPEHVVTLALEALYEMRAEEAPPPVTSVRIEKQATSSPGARLVARL